LRGFGIHPKRPLRRSGSQGLRKRKLPALPPAITNVRRLTCSSLSGGKLFSTGKNVFATSRDLPESFNSRFSKTSGKPLFLNCYKHCASTVGTAYAHRWVHKHITTTAQAFRMYA